ncbi:type VI secretion system baseplate subunit TssG [Candidatus Poribacteria bacterium]|nr:type VI secretion system baseplate subunit TssG [Candidatus Poribacteria bacterium]
MESGTHDPKKQEKYDREKISSSVVNRLFQKGHRFSFFQAVSLLEKLYKDAAHPGEEGPLNQEKIRFHASSRQSFPASDISKVEHIQRDDRDYVRMILNFMGLYGVDSPLPTYFSEIISRVPDEDVDTEEEPDEEESGIKALRKFLDIFDHRIYSLFYRSWMKYRYHLQFEPEAKDNYSRYLLSFLGLGTQDSQRIFGKKISRLIAYSGIMSQNTRCADGLAGFLSEYYYGVEVEILEFIPQWISIPDQYRARLNSRQPLILGEDTTIGHQIMDYNNKFRVVLGPISFEMLIKFLPGKRNFRELCNLIYLYTSRKLSFDVQFVMKKTEVPPLQLKSEDDREINAQLGLTTWLGEPQSEKVQLTLSPY